MLGPLLHQPELSSVAGKTAPLLVVDDSTCLPLQLRQTLLFSTALVQAGTVFRQMCGVSCTPGLATVWTFQVYPDRDTDHGDIEHGDILDNPTTHLQLTIEQFIEEVNIIE
jgi:hypothetical protein